MKYGQIVNNKEFSSAIYHCFEHLSCEDQQKFVKKFRRQSHDFEQRMHTFGELILGAYLSSRGFKLRHDYPVESKTPDWCILDKKSAVINIIDLVNYHRDKDTENEIDKQMQAKGHAIFWSRENLPKNRERLYKCIWGKMQTYQALIEKLRVPYTVAICPDWRAELNFDDKIRDCLHDSKSGLFQRYQYVSGVLYFKWNLDQCSFTYEQNPNALRSVDLPSGVFSLVKEEVEQLSME